MEYSSSSDGSCSCSRMENGLVDCRNYTKIHEMIRWKSGKRVDARLVGVLEPFGEIYVERYEFFKKIFHGDYEELFKKIGDALKRKKQMKKNRSLPRSTSMRAIGSRGINSEIEDLRLKRFKVRTPKVIVAGSEGTDDQGGQAQDFSKNSK